MVVRLAEVLERRGPLEVSVVCAVAEQVASGLDALHADGRLHAKVAPGSILLDEEGTASITDLGGATEAQGGPLAARGEVVGSLDYMAPEQIRREELTPAVDVYGLGCVIYECVCGAAPFAHQQGMRTLWAHLRDTPANLSQRRPDVPSAASVVILQALEKDPAGRTQSAGAFAQQLRAACN